MSLNRNETNQNFFFAYIVLAKTVERKRKLAEFKIDQNCFAR